MGFFFLFACCGAFVSILYPFPSLFCMVRPCQACSDVLAYGSVSVAFVRARLCVCLRACLFIVPRAIAKQERATLTCGRAALSPLCFALVIAWRIVRATLPPGGVRYVRFHCRPLTCAGRASGLNARGVTSPESVALRSISIMGHGQASLKRAVMLQLTGEFF